jgi:hypothetical protein
MSVVFVYIALPVDNTNQYTEMQTQNGWNSSTDDVAIINGYKECVRCKTY